MKIQINLDSNINYNQNDLFSAVGIIILDDDIFINIQNLSDIYPKYSKRFKKIIKQQININNKYELASSISDLRRILDGLQDDLKYQIEKGECIFHVNSYNKYTFIKIIEVCKNGCIIDLTNLKQQEIINLLEQNDFPDNIKFIDPYNIYSLLTKEQLLNTYQNIYQIANLIKQYNLTPLESLIFLYDIVREKPYKEFNEDKSKSRDLSQITNDDYIVCEGYANIINAVCHSLNIPSEKIRWLPKEGNRGHASNIVYINDDKYDIHGFFEIDALYGVKENNEDMEYINHYEHLFDPFNLAIIKKKKYNYDDELTLCLPLNQYERIKHMEKINMPDIIRENFYNLFIKQVSRVADIIGFNSLLNLCDQELEEIKQHQFSFDHIELIHQKYINLMNKKIEYDIMIEAIYKVRRIEHLIDPKRYPLSPYIFDKIIKNSFPLKAEEHLLNLIFENTPIDKISNSALLEDIKIEDPTDKIDYDIKRIELLSSLKQELKNKQKIKS